MSNESLEPITERDFEQPELGAYLNEVLERLADYETNPRSKTYLIPNN